MDSTSHIMNLKKGYLDFTVLIYPTIDIISQNIQNIAVWVVGYNF